MLESLSGLDPSLGLLEQQRHPCQRLAVHGRIGRLLNVRQEEFCLQQFPFDRLVGLDQSGCKLHACHGSRGMASEVGQVLTQ